MNPTEELDYVIVYDENDQPHKRPRNKLYEQVAAKQEQRRRMGTVRHEWTPLIGIKGEPLSETIVRERRGDFD